MFTFQFITERREHSRQGVRQRKIDSEMAIGLLSALTLALSSVLFFSTTNPWIVGCGFISSALFVGAVSCSTLKILILSQLNEAEAPIFVDKLGSFNRMTGQIFMAGCLCWLLGLIPYLLNTLS
jgi:hypothetical protein